MTKDKNIFGTATETNDGASLELINIIDRAILSLSYEDKVAFREIVDEMYLERDAIDSWREAYLNCWDDGNDCDDAKVLVSYMGFMS